MLFRSNEVGTKCDKCKGEILQENIDEYIEQLNLDINSLNSQLQTQVQKSKDITKKVDDVKEKQTKIKEIIKKVNTEISNLDNSMTSLRNELVKASQVREPKADNEEALLQQKIESTNEQIQTKTNELNGESP